VREFSKEELTALLTALGIAIVWYKDKVPPRYRKYGSLATMEKLHLEIMEVTVSDP
jgi:hypothetical protein